MGNKEIDKKRKLNYFLNEIKRQCEYSFMSLEKLEDAVNSDKAGAQEIFYNLHNLFNNLGNISKILYPTKKYRARGKELRELLSISDNSQFDSRKDRNVLRRYRNIMEHYDEYFEDWFDQSDNSIIIDSNVGNENMINVNGSKPQYLRFFNPDEFKFIFLNEEYKLQEVINETYYIYNKISNIKGAEMIAFTRE